MKCLWDWLLVCIPLNMCKCQHCPSGTIPADGAAQILSWWTQIKAIYSYVGDHDIGDPSHRKHFIELDIP